MGLFLEPEKWVIKKEKRQAEGIVQKLAEGVELELMEIPGGTLYDGNRRRGNRKTGEKIWLGWI
jgi:hypothetical protein